MTIERKVRAFAGSLILLGFVLAWLVSPYFLILPVFMGLNLLQSAFTGFCPAEKFLASRRPAEPAPANLAQGAAPRA